MSEQLRRIRSNVNNIAVRGRLTLIDNKKSIQRQQNEIFAEQIMSDIPAPQQYGFESAPLIGADTINLNRGGSLESGWVVMTYDGRYKPLDLEDGDTIVYTKRDASQDKVHRIKFDAESGEILVETDELVNIKCKNANIEVEEDANMTVGNNATINVTEKITVTTKVAEVNVSESASIDCPNTVWNGNFNQFGNLSTSVGATGTASPTSTISVVKGIVTSIN